MKKGLRITMMCVAMLVIVIGLVGCGQTYTLNLPTAESVTSATITLDNDARTIETPENISAILSKLKGTADRTTKTESVQDAPGVAKYMTITFQPITGTSSYFIYEDKGKYYIEHPYNGVYEITADEYNDIVKFYDELKQKPMTIEEQNLTSRITKLTPVDRHGKSFNTADLTNDELLLYGFLQFNPKGNGFLDITFKILNQTYIKGSFGRTDAQPKDIICSCGVTLATHNAANDTFTWDDTFHYENHKADTFNEIKEIYKIEEKYIVEVYKIFPDVLETSSPTEYNFYGTYNDAKAKTNAIFTVANESEFTNAVQNLEDSKKTLYKLTFKKEKGSFKLMNYEIVK